jgi:hypothetical protein
MRDRNVVHPIHPSGDARVGVGRIFLCPISSCQAQRLVVPGTVAAVPGTEAAVARDAFVEAILSLARVWHRVRACLTLGASARHHTHA